MSGAEREGDAGSRKRYFAAVETGADVCYIIKDYDKGSISTLPMEVKMVSEVMVSAYCLAYNHEKYIRDALEGFVSQKTNFKYEVIVHDDASTDHTAEIIAEYAAKYPDIIKPIYEEENQYSKGVNISKDIIFPHLSGKYIAICEGDDYWCDENKLQRQFDFLEAHPYYTACVHNTRVIDYLVNWTGPMYEQERDKDLSFREIANYGIAAFHISSILLHREFYPVPEEISSKLFGDYPLSIYLRLNGKIWYMKDVMSVYRENTAGSWTRRNRSDADKERLISIQKQTADFTESVYHYCVKTGAASDVLAAIKDVADRDRVQEQVLRRGVLCLLTDQRKKFMGLSNEKKIHVLDMVWKQIKGKLGNGKK